VKSKLIINNSVGETVQRPWGSYKVLEYKNNQLVKQIDVFPGEMLSLQSHYHRNEHWTVVSGVAHIQKDDEILCL
jgi:mannose-6-phosphate isomerase-like protein (cupin superfamily)